MQDLKQCWDVQESQKSSAFMGDHCLFLEHLFQVLNWIIILKYIVDVFQHEEWGLYQ